MRWRFALVVTMLVLNMTTIVKGGDLLVSSGGQEIKYIATLSGSINGNPFDKAKVLVRLAPSSLGDPNPYLLIVEGLPEKNAEHAFFWTSRDTTMEVLDQTIICRTRARYTRKQPDVHFFYISPILLQVEHVTHREEENLELARQTALPTKVFAQIGELKVTFTGTQIVGSVRIKGYDFVENAYVEYYGKFSGHTDAFVKPKLEKLKKIGTFIVEPGGE
ncbi:MAG: hypothetical protein N2260_10380 [Syntrophobacterales bacterium]|nr:hypothetical protein [Syntrophobacterales bacterium]